MRVFGILLDYREAFSAGLIETARLTGSVWGIGLTFGTALAIGANRWRRGVGIPTATIGFLLSGVPILVLLFWLHYPVQELLGIVVPPFYTSVAALALVNTILVAMVVWNALASFPGEFRVAADVCGLSSKTFSTRIQFPLIVREILPPIVIVQVIMLQSTLFASLISVNEVFRVAQRVNARIYQPTEIYTGLALLFLLICLPLNGLALVLRKKFGRDLSER